MNLFRNSWNRIKKKIGIEKPKAPTAVWLPITKESPAFHEKQENTEDIVIEELEKSFIEDYYNWMLGTCALANSTVFGRVNTLKWLMYIAQEKGWIRVHPFASFSVCPNTRRRSFLSKRNCKNNPYRTEIQTPACHARHVPVHVFHRSFLRRPEKL